MSPRQSETQDLPAMEGPGVAPVRIKELDRLGDKMTEMLEDRAAISEKVSDTEKKMAEIMAERGITKYKWSDKEMLIKIGATHVKVKTVRNEGVSGDE